MHKIIIISILILLSCDVYGQTRDTQDSVQGVVENTKKGDSTEANSIDSLLTANNKKTVDLVKDELTVTNPPSFSDFLTVSEILWTLVIIVVGYFSINFFSRILELFAEKSTRYRITIKSFIPVVKIVGWLVVISLIIVGVFQPPATTVLAFSASVGVAVGFASQDILKNIFGGIMILFDRPFNSGDKIEVGNYYGEVVEIGLRSTRILTPDDSLVSIPNGEIMNSSVSNANTGEPNCQVVAEFYLPIDIDTQKVRDIAIQSAQVSKYVFLNKPVAVIFINEYKDRRSVLKMRLKAYVLDIRDEFKFKSDMTELVIKKLVSEGIIKDS